MPKGKFIILFWEQLFFNIPDSVVMKGFKRLLLKVRLNA